MLPVAWKENQPIILPEGDVITYTADRSYGPAPLWTANGLAKEAFFIRTPLVPCYDINSKGQLEMTASSTDLNQKRQPAAIGRWINNWPFTAQTGSFITELLNLEATQGEKEKLPILWTSYMSGLLSGSTAVNTKLAIEGVNQAYTQSSYLTNK